MNAPRRRALSLIEVLAATVLLALVAGTCASLLRSIPLAAPADDRPMRFDELSCLAQDLLCPTEDSPSSELLRRWIDDRSASLELPWPGDPVHPPLSLLRLATTDPTADHAWLEFRSAEARVWRWVVVDVPPAEHTP